jgi:uncharacterized protein (TIGR00290 family)
MKPKTIFNWSTGKDSALALHTILAQSTLDVQWLLTTVNDQHDRVSMHGVRTELLEAQAAALGIPLVQVRLPDTPTMHAYETTMTATLTTLRDQGAEVSVFGDIFLEDLRAYRERRLAEIGLRAIFPLWQQPTDRLVRNVIDLGFKAITTCVNARHLGQEFVGQVVDDAFVRALPPGVDPCGENGEFHTFTYDGPIFAHPIAVRTGEIVYRTYERPVAVSVGATARTSDETTSSYECQPASAEDPFETGFWYCDLVRTG